MILLSIELRCRSVPGDEIAEITRFVSTHSRPSGHHHFQHQPFLFWHYHCQHHRHQQYHLNNHRHRKLHLNQRHLHCQHNHFQHHHCPMGQSSSYINIIIGNIVKQFNCNRVMTGLFVWNFFSTAAIGEVWSWKVNVTVVSRQVGIAFVFATSSFSTRAFQSTDSDPLWWSPQYFKIHQGVTIPLPPLVHIPSENMTLCQAHDVILYPSF